MKKTMFKIAGVKNDKEFYDKYPTEASFMKKHAKEFQAKCGGKIKKAQYGDSVADLDIDMEDLYDINESSGIQFTQQGANQLFKKIQPIEEPAPSGLNLGKYKGMGYFDINQQNDEYRISPTKKNPHNPDSYKGVMQYIQEMNPNAKFTKNNTYIDPSNRGMKYGGKINYAHDGYEAFDSVNTTQNTIDFNTVNGKSVAGPSSGGGFRSFMEKNGEGLLDVAGGLVQGFSALKGEKDKLNETKQNRMVSDVMVDASRTREEAPERRYVRPEDIQNTGEEFFPIYGVGTNVLAETGGTFRAPKGRQKTDKQLKEEELILIKKDRKKKALVGADIYSDVANKFIGAGFDNNAGFQIGSSVGKLIPIPGAGAVTGLIGGALDQAFGPAGKIKKEEDNIKHNMTSLIGNEMGRFAASQYAGHMETGGNISSMDGDLNVYKGNAKTISYNPFMPDGGETVMFNGPSHAEGGMPISYGGSPVEVEGGEPAMKLENGTSGEENLTVFGNLKIPKEFTAIDPKAKGKKFKNYINDLSKVENKSNKILNKSMEELSKLDVNTSFDKLKLSSLKANILGPLTTLKILKEKKTKAASLQNAINQTAEEFNIDADALSRGNIKNAKNGTYINKAEDGKETPKKVARAEVDKYKKEGWVLSPDGKQLVKKGEPSKTIQVSEGTPAKYENSSSDFSTGQVTKMYENRMSDEDWKKYLEQETPEQKAARRAREQAEGYRTGFTQGSTEQQLITPATDPVYETRPATPDEYMNIYDPGTEPIPYKRSKLMDFANEILPFIRPSDKEALNANQLLGEQYAMATNQLEPVQAQTYKPQLDVPYDISLQDIRNENQADYRAGQRMMGYNPTGQAMLNAQKYAANQKVGAEEFRLNQAKKDQVYSGNRATMNDAQLKNLAIYDTQYQRQSQAKSNTKATAQAALNSISDKYAKNQLENRTLQTYENLYNYRFGNDFRAMNMNGFFQSNIPTVGAQEGQIQVPVYDENNNIIRYQLQSSPKQPSYSTQGYNPATKNGGSIKGYKNGGLVKALKNI